MGNKVYYVEEHYFNGLDYEDAAENICIRGIFTDKEKAMSFADELILKDISVQEYTKDIERLMSDLQITDSEYYQKCIKQAEEEHPYLLSLIEYDDNGVQLVWDKEKYSELNISSRIFDHMEIHESGFIAYEVYEAELDKEIKG